MLRRCLPCLSRRAAPGLKLEPLSPAGGLVVTGDGGDGNVQLHELDDAGLATLRESFLGSRTGVLLARGQRPGDVAGLRRVAKAVSLGPLMETSQGPVQQYVATGRRGTPAARNPRGSDFWHQDNSYLETPGQFTGLYATGEVPGEEGDTEFANLTAAWAAWGGDEGAREAARKLHAWHCHAHNCGHPHPQHPGGASMPPQRHPVVRRHPATGHESLLLSPCYLKGPDAPAGAAYEEAAELMRELTEHATSPAFVFRHRWRPGDLLFWDNFTVMHRATTIHMSPEVKRVMFRLCLQD